LESQNPQTFNHHSKGPHFDDPILFI
jgi:hypothetical protein